MPMDRGTPDLVRHCVAAVAQQYGGDTSKAFAICVAQLQKNGYLKPGTMELTAAGKAKEKEHEAEPDAAKKLKSYEKLLKANRKGESIGEARYDVTPDGKLRFEYMDELLTAETPVGTFELFRPKGGRPSNLSAWDWTSPQGKVLASGEESSEKEAMAKCQKLFDAAMAKKESKFSDFDRLMNPSVQSGFEDAPRTIARKYESVSKNESSMDAMRRLAGIGSRYADRAFGESQPAPLAKSIPVKSLAEAAPLDVLEKIAKKHLFIDTLSVRRSDRLDFHDVGVGSLKDALEAAYEAGLQAAKASKQ